MRKDIATIVGLVTVLFILVLVQGYLGHLVERQRGKKTAIKIGQTTILSTIADTKEERTKGLAQRDSLAPNEGMLLVFENDGYHQIWMKGMKIPIDIIWISADKKIVAIEKNVKPPRPSASDFELKIYTPKDLARYVLEVQAGLTDRLNINFGQPVIFDLTKKSVVLGIFQKGF